MPVLIDSWQPDGDGGYFIQWTDLSQPLTAFIHATPELMDEFVTHHRKGRAAPTGRLSAARDGMRDSNLSDVATVQRFREAYEELVDDLTDLKARGLRHNTPYSEHQHIRQGMKPETVHLKDPQPDGFRQFIATRNGP